MLKINIKRNDLKRKSGDMNEEDIRNNDNSPCIMSSSSGSQSDSDREDLLHTMNEPLFAEFFAKKRKIESMDTQSSTSSGSQSLSRESSPQGNSPNKLLKKGKEQDSSGSSTSDTEESTNTESLQPNRYEFQPILDSFTEQKFSKGTSISSLSSQDSSKSLKNIRSMHKRRMKNMPKNPRESNSRSPQFKERLLPNNTQGLDFFRLNPSVWSYYKNGVISPSTSLDGFKRENSTVSESLTSNSSVKSFEEFQQDPEKGNDGRSTTSKGSSPTASSRSSSSSVNQQDYLHDNLSSSEDSDTNSHQNNSSNNWAEKRKYNASIWHDRSEHGVGSYVAVRTHMYLIAPDGYIRYKPYTDQNRKGPASRLMNSNLETESLKTNNQMEYVGFQSSTSDTGWFNHNKAEHDRVQISHINSNNLYKSAQNNDNEITNNFTTVENQTTRWSHFQDSSVDNNMERYYKEQNTMPNIENFEQKVENITTYNLTKGNQDIMQMNWPNISYGTNTNFQSGDWSDLLNATVYNNSLTTSQYPDMWKKQQESKYENGIQMINNPTHQYQNLYHDISQQNYQEANTLHQESSYQEAQTNEIINKEAGVKEPKSQMAFIALAIMSHPERKMTLSEIYHHIETNHQRYLKRPDWRNGVRHTLSHNACFIKIEKALHRPRKGHYWSIHPACIQEFSGGKFCLRRSKRLIMEYENPCFPSEVPPQDVPTDFNEASTE